MPWTPALRTQQTTNEAVAASEKEATEREDRWRNAPWTPAPPPRAQQTTNEPVAASQKGAKEHEDRWSVLNSKRKASTAESTEDANVSDTCRFCEHMTTWGCSNTNRIPSAYVSLCDGCLKSYSDKFVVDDDRCAKFARGMTMLLIKALLKGHPAFRTLNFAAQRDAIHTLAAFIDAERLDAARKSTAQQETSFMFEVAHVLLLNKKGKRKGPLLRRSYALKRSYM